MAVPLDLGLDLPPGTAGHAGSTSPLGWQMTEEMDPQVQFNNAFDQAVFGHENLVTAVPENMSTVWDFGPVLKINVKQEQGPDGKMILDASTVFNISNPELLKNSIHGEDIVVKNCKNSTIEFKVPGRIKNKKLMEVMVFENVWPVHNILEHHDFFNVVHYESDEGDVIDFHLQATYG